MGKIGIDGGVEMVRQDIGEARVSDLLDDLRAMCREIDENKRGMDTIEMGCAIAGKFERLDEQISRGWSLPSQWK